MSTSWFDPRDLRCKSPFGAVPCGAAVTFCFRPERGAAITRCELLAHGEFADRWTTLELAPVFEDGGMVYRGVFTAPDDIELVWYHFRLSWADGGTSCCGKAGLCAWDAVEPWQLTVYDDTHKTPEWFGRGLTYQIFPDRFCRAKKRDVAGLVGARTLHERWDELPEYRPNAQGEITCSDFFGGDLQGITEKLDYLASLGVTTLYLCPIFEASTNHRYDTACYERIDPLLGDEEDFRTLCAEAKKRGIHVMLDGVFNHTGRKSVYFNADGFYPDLGAAQGEQSPYYRWYNFHPFPDEYDAWWGIKNLPAVNELEKSYVDYIIEGENSIIKRWLRAGASGWRLDVADELPDAFIEKIRAAMNEVCPDSYLLGEVWEDGTTKIAYSQRRRYLLGRETNGLMNYPFRTALMAFLLGGGAEYFRDSMEQLRENYPAPAFYGAMNFLSTHDTPRLLTILGLSAPAPQTRDERAVYRLSEEELAHGKALLKLASLILYTFPGSPMLYYGDEAGMQGFEDPFNRGTYPWGHEDEELLRCFRQLGALRRAHEALQSGTIVYHAAQGRVLAFSRRAAHDHCLTVVVAEVIDFKRYDCEIRPAVTFHYTFDVFFKFSGSRAIQRGVIRFRHIFAAFRCGYIDKRSGDRHDHTHGKPRKRAQYAAHHRATFAAYFIRRIHACERHVAVFAAERIYRKNVIL